MFTGGPKQLSFVYVFKETPLTKKQEVLFGQVDMYLSFKVFGCLRILPPWWDQRSFQVPGGTLHTSGLCELIQAEINSTKVMTSVCLWQLRGGGWGRAKALWKNHLLIHSPDKRLCPCNVHAFSPGLVWKVTGHFRDFSVKPMAVLHCSKEWEDSTLVGCHLPLTNGSGAGQVRGAGWQCGSSGRSMANGSRPVLDLLPLPFSTLRS